VTASLARALPVLTNACRTEYLWIDQITIDQSNVPERSDQVKTMRAIYSQSSRCLIWMASDLYLEHEHEYDTESDWSHGVGEDVLDFFQSFAGDDLPNPWQTTPGEEVPRRLSQSSQRPITRRQSVVRDHLLWFFEHPWFNRTWVYQEFVLAPQPVFLIGDFELPGLEIEAVFKLGWPRSAAWFDTFHHRLNLSKTRATVFHRAPGLEFLLAAVQSRLLFIAPQAADLDLPFASGGRHLNGFEPMRH
jgi:hypothetical protein